MTPAASRRRRIAAGPRKARGVGASEDVFARTGPHIKLTIALPKGRLLSSSVALLRKIGIRPEGLTANTRRLAFGGGRAIRILIVRAVDVPTYVEQGAADLGIVGKDVLLEQGKDLYETLDLGFGRCRIVLARPQAERNGRPMGVMRIATKYPNVTENYFSRKGVPVEIIRLSGAIELAPSVGLAEGVVDLIETGRTLRQNRLAVVEEIAHCTARLVVNRASLKLKHQEIDILVRRLRMQIGGNR